MHDVRHNLGSFMNFQRAYGDLQWWTEFKRRSIDMLYLYMMYGVT